MKKPILNVTIPLQTEVISLHSEMIMGYEWDSPNPKDGLTILMDIRNKNWNEILGISKKSKIRWTRIKTVNILELSSLFSPIRYRLTIGEGYWKDSDKKRHYFCINDHLPGIDIIRGVTTVTLRAAVLLSILSCVGLRSVSWLMNELFHVNISKSSLHRWIKEISSHIPNKKELIKLLIEQKPVSECHLDEFYPKGRKLKGCVLTIKDEHGRILIRKEVEEKTKDAVVEFLTEVKEYGLDFKRFYVDGCDEFRKAIIEVYPKAIIQYDYFHIMQNVIRNLWKSMIIYRRSIKKEARITKESGDKYRAKELDAFAKELWKKRGLIFKNPKNLSDSESKELLSLMSRDTEVAKVRWFLLKVWGIFDHSKNELGARQRLGKLQRRSEVLLDRKKGPFKKSVRFLVSRFDDMIAFISHEGVQRNSLAESGMRSLRRLEQGHDGLRSLEGRDNYFRLYQAIRYLGWSVHNGNGFYGLNVEAIDSNQHIP